MKKILDLGCGTGIQGIVAGIYGADKIIFSDISKNAIENTNENVKKFGLFEKSEVILSNLFENIDGKFDVIVFNHPFFAKKKLEDNIVSGTMLDDGMLIHRFFEQVEKKLEKDGVIIMPYFHLAGETNNPTIQIRQHSQFKCLERFRANISPGLQNGLASIYEISFE